MDLASAKVQRILIPTGDERAIWRQFAHDYIDRLPFLAHYLLDPILLERPLPMVAPLISDPAKFLGRRITDSGSLNVDYQAGD